jgi:ADP-heptose:LPS heptosyltransferase
MSGLPHLEAPTLIPLTLRRWLGARLQGPPPGSRRRLRQACGVALGRIGDFILMLPSFRLLVREFGAAQCALVIPEAVAPLARVELPGVELITLPPEAYGLIRDILPVWWRQRRKFAADRFERRVVFMHLRSFYHGIAASWVDASHDFRLAPEAYPFGPGAELLAHRTVTAAALGREVAWEEILPCFTQFSARHDGRLLVYPLSHDGSKNLPVERVVAILRLWRARSRAPIVLGGSPRDVVTLEHYATAARAAGLDGITVEAPVGVIAFIEHIASASAVFSADSAAAHVGGAFDKPTVTLMPKVWHGVSQPWHRSQRQQAHIFDEADDTTVAAALAALA